jgi:hypothetical protein
MAMKRLWLLLAPLILCAETAEERGERIIRESFEALGGQRFLEMRDRVERGRVYSFYQQRLRGFSVATLYTRYLTRAEPPRPEDLYVRERQSFGKDKEMFAYLFDEKTGYEITFRGARPMPEPIILRYQDTARRNVLYIFRQRLGEPGLKTRFLGTDILDNQPVEIVEIYDANNDSVTVYFHRSTRFPLMQTWVRRDPKTRERFEEVTRYGNFRDVGGGVHWPYHIRRERNGERIFEQFSETVAINQNLDDSLFMLPAGTKVLPPAR